MTLLQIRCEQFIYAPFNGVGYKLIGTPHLTHIIGSKSLSYLKRLSDSRQTYLPHEKLVAITHVTPTRDNAGRQATFNHTILIPLQEYFNLHPPALFERYFIKHLDKPLSNLEPLKVETHE